MKEAFAARKPPWVHLEFHDYPWLFWLDPGYRAMALEIQEQQEAAQNDAEHKPDLLTMVNPFAKGPLLHEREPSPSPMVDSAALVVTDLVEAVGTRPCPQNTKAAGRQKQAQPVSKALQLEDTLLIPQDTALSPLLTKFEDQESQDLDLLARAKNPDWTSLLSRMDTLEATLNAPSTRVPEALPTGEAAVALPVFGLLLAYAAWKCRSRTRPKSTVAIAPVASRKGEISIVKQ